MVISDNGASSEGGPTGTTNEAQFFNNAQEPFEDSLAAIDEIGGPKHFNHYPWGWTFAGNTPFRRWKRETYRGGVSDPFIVSWPKGIAATGEVREQYAHAIDMVPTVLDVLGIEPPATIRGVPQSPLHGASLAHTFDDSAAASRRTTQYFEMMGHRSIYHDGWRAVCPWPGPSFTEAGKGFGEPISAEMLAQLDAEGWELYHVAEDPAENHDLAAEHRDRLIALIATWYVEAGKYDVMPIDGSGLARFGGGEALDRRAARPVHLLPATRSRCRSSPVRGCSTARTASPPTWRSPADGAEGVLLAQGTAAGGFTLYVKDRRLHYTHNWVGRELFHVESDAEVGAGRHALRFEFEPTGTARPRQGPRQPGPRCSSTSTASSPATARSPYTTPFAFNPGALTCGADPGSTVTADYDGPFRFTGTIDTVTVDLSGELIRDPEAELKLHMARQ